MYSKLFEQLLDLIYIISGQDISLNKINKKKKNNTEYIDTVVGKEHRQRKKLNKYSNVNLIDDITLTSKKYLYHLFLN